MNTAKKGKEEELKKYCKMNITEESMLDMTVSHLKCLLLWFRSKIVECHPKFQTLEASGVLCNNQRTSKKDNMMEKIKSYLIFNKIRKEN